jgi:hypothetical protein
MLVVEASGRDWIAQTTDGVIDDLHVCCRSPAVGDPRRRRRAARRPCDLLERRHAAQPFIVWRLSGR